MNMAKTSTTKNTPKAEPVTRKEAILQAAQEVFGMHGYSATTMKMIAERAGVAFGLVSHYYGNKEHLFLHAGFTMIDRLMKHVTGDIKDADSGLDAVVRYVNSYLSFTEENRDTFPILVRCSPFSDVELKSERGGIAAKFMEIISTLQQLVEKGVKDGSISSELNPEQTAFLIFGNILVAVRTSLITPYRVPGLYEETTRYVMRSLRPCERGEDRPCVFDTISLID